MTTPNKALWDSVFTTDPAHVKPITGKDYGGNSPKPYWIIQRATEVFGPCGIGWGYRIDSERFERFGNDALHVAQVTVWYEWQGKRGEVTQMGQTKAAYTTSKGQYKIDEDAPKKSITDALVKCLSYLGFAGDIFSGRWDDSKYVAHAARVWSGTDQDANGKTASIISPRKLAWDALNPEQQAKLEALAKQTEAMMPDAEGALDEIDWALGDEQDQRAALSYRLSTTTNAALKKASLARNQKETA